MPIIFSSGTSWTSATTFLAQLAIFPLGILGR
jgi:hypothetical protein